MAEKNAQATGFLGDAKAGAHVEGRMMREILELLNRWNEEVSKIEDELERVEGRRFLLRVLALSVENYIENSNADQPHFRSAITDVRKVFADSPDTDYIRSNMLLSGKRVYRIHGLIPPTTVYWGVQLYRAKGTAGKHMPDKDIPIKKDRTFELLITADRANIPERMRNLPVFIGDGDEVAVIVRQYFIDRTKEPPMRIFIERVDPPEQSYTLNPQLFMQGARLTLSDVDSVLTKTFMAHQLLSAASDSHFMIPEAAQLFPTLDNRYSVAWCHELNEKLPKDDYPVILVSGVRPKSRYFSCVLYNRYLESLDYTRYPVYLNHAQMFFGHGNKFELAIARKNPGHKNFISTNDHNCVYVLLRELLPEGQPQEFKLERTTASALLARKDRTFLGNVERPRL